MTLYRIVWDEPIIRELSDGRVVWLVQTCERWAVTLAGADQIGMDLSPTRYTFAVARFGEQSAIARFCARWDDHSQVERWEVESWFKSSSPDKFYEIRNRIDQALGGPGGAGRQPRARRACKDCLQVGGGT